MLDEARLGLDISRCDGCGLCLPACPQEALQLTPMPDQNLLIRKGYALATCERAAPKGISTGVLPCLHALGLRALARLAAKGIKGLWVSPGECGSCARGRNLGLVDAVSRLNVLLQSRGMPGFTLSTIPISQWREEYFCEAEASIAPLDAGRRGFLLGLAGRRHKAGSMVFNGKTLPESPPAATAGMRGAEKGLAEWCPRIDSRICEGCDACVRVCPTAALALEEFEGHVSYRVIPDACSGCSLCRDVCSQRAVELQTLGPALPFRINLHRRACRACGVEYHIPMEHNEYCEYCPVCRRVNHARHLFQVLK